MINTFEYVSSLTCDMSLQHKADSKINIYDQIDSSFSVTADSVICIQEENEFFPLTQNE